MAEEVYNRLLRAGFIIDFCKPTLCDNDILGIFLATKGMGLGYVKYLIRNRCFLFMMTIQKK